jgi:hypothetical protein
MHLTAVLYAAVCFIASLMLLLIHLHPGLLSCRTVPLLCTQAYATQLLHWLLFNKLLWLTCLVGSWVQGNLMCDPASS